MIATTHFFRAIILCFFIGFGISSCSLPDEEPRPFECLDDALFSREDATGTMFYLSCYDAWSIKMDEMNTNNDHLFAASLDIPEAFKEEGMEVTFNACFYDFDLELLFPDPTFFGETYVIKDFVISKSI